VFNRAEMILRTLESVFAQRFDDYEVIVVDDGSTDGSVKAVRQFEGPVKLIEQDNAGPAIARNTGIEAATGEYVAFLDSDDLYLPWTLENYAAAIERENKPTVVHGQRVDVESDSEADAIREQPLRLSSYADYYGAPIDLFISASALCIQRAALQEVGGFVNRFINAEDCDLCMRLGCKPGFVTVDAPASFCYRRHDESLISVSERTLAGIEHLVSQERLGVYPGGPGRKQRRRAIISRHARPAILDAARSGHRKAAWRLYRRTLGWHLRMNRCRFLAGFWAVMLRGA